jgi:hypothetical protein
MNSARDIFSPKRFYIVLAVFLVGSFLGPFTGVESFFYRDFGVLGYPTASYHREMFWRGELPLWNPYSNCGVPFLAQWGTMTLYPFSLIYLLLPFPWSLNFFCLAHLWFGAVGVFRLAQRWTNSNRAAATASVLFLFNGITLSSLSWANYTVAFAWAPWIIFFAESACASRRGILLAALAGAMQMLAGAPELTLLTWALAIVLCAARFGKSTLRLTLVIALIAGLCAIQLLPFFELLAHSQRQTGAVADKWSIPILGLGNFVLPMLHAFKTSPGTIFQHDQHFLSSTYLGATATLLAIAGAIKGGLRPRLLLLATFIALLFALGTNLPTFALVQKLPVLGLARYPVKFALLNALTIPLAAAFGIRALEETKISRAQLLGYAALLLVPVGLLFMWVMQHPFQYDRPRETTLNSLQRVVLFALAIGLLAFRERRAYFFPLFLFCLFLDLRFHLPNQNPTTNIATLKMGLHTHDFPKLAEGRVFISPQAEDRLLRSSLTNLDADFVGKQLAVWSHLNLIELVPKVNGSATLNVREQKEVQDWLYDKTNSHNINLDAWLDFLAVTQTTAPGQVVEWTNRPTAKPLLTIATNFLEKPEENLPLGEATIKNFTFNEKEINATVSAKSPATLVVAQSWYPAWRAQINGAPAPIHKINHAFQAVVVPAGESVVQFRYGPPFAGAMISFLSLGACCWLLRPARERP